MGSQGKAEACFLLLISDALPHRRLLSPCSAKCLLIAPLTPQNVVSVTVSGFVLITVQKTAPDLLDGTASHGKFCILAAGHHFEEISFTPLFWSGAKFSTGADLH